MIRVDRLNRPFTIREIARMAGWSYLRMKAHLLRLHAESGNNLLAASAPPNRRYTVMLPALQRVAPEMFASAETLDDRVEALEALAKDLELGQRRLALQVADNAREIVRLRAAPTVAKAPRARTRP